MPLSDFDVYELLDQLGPEQLHLIQRMESQRQAIEIVRLGLASSDESEIPELLATVFDVADRLDRSVQDAVFAAGRAYA